MGAPQPERTGKSDAQITGHLHGEAGARKNKQIPLSRRGSCPPGRIQDSLTAEGALAWGLRGISRRRRWESESWSERRGGQPSPPPARVVARRADAETSDFCWDAQWPPCSQTRLMLSEDHGSWALQGPSLLCLPASCMSAGPRSIHAALLISSYPKAAQPPSSDPHGLTGPSVKSACVLPSLE